MLQEGCLERIEKDYHDHLYRLDESHIFRIPNEGEVNGIIRGVEPTGRLQVEINGRIRGFLFREIEFVL